MRQQQFNNFLFIFQEKKQKEVGETSFFFHSGFFCRHSLFWSCKSKEGEAFLLSKILLKTFNAYFERMLIRLPHAFFFDNPGYPQNFSNLMKILLRKLLF